jgi:hypothetical protein
MYEQAGPDPEQAGPDPGVPGASARREYERQRDRRLREKAGRSWLVRLLAAVLGPSTREKRHVAQEGSWASGAEGERIVGEYLDRRCPSVQVLHDRRIPHSRANIDHIAIAPSGVYVIDTKRYRGKIRVAKPLFGSPRLIVAGRDQTRLVDGLARQLSTVQRALAGVAPDVPIQGCLCFVSPNGLLAGTELPVLRTLEIAGHPLYYPRRLVKRLNAHGPLTPEHARRIQRRLAERLPPA